jgi:hypothetical protein
MPVFHSPVQITVLKSLEAIEVMLDSRQRTAFLPFLGREVSVSQAAQEVSELPNTMLYRIKRWQRLGLLLETRKIQHQKGWMRLYRSSADAFFVPHSATKAEDLLALAIGIYTPLIANFLNAYVKSGERLSSDWGVRFERSGNDWSVRPIKSADDQCEPTDDDAPPSLLDLLEVQLSAKDAKSLQRELRALVEKYVHRNNKNAKPYQVMIGLA